MTKNIPKFLFCATFGQSMSLYGCGVRVFGSSCFRLYCGFCIGDGLKSMVREFGDYGGVIKFFDG